MAFVAAGLAATQTAKTVLPQIGNIFGKIFGGNPRRGGPDPCCPDPHPSGFKAGAAPSPWPRNSGRSGAPPDFRSLGDPSPGGEGRLKDDACDCIPVLWQGRRWVIGTIGQRGGFVRATDMPDPSAARWLSVEDIEAAAVSFTDLADRPTIGRGIPRGSISTARREGILDDPARSRLVDQRAGPLQAGLLSLPTNTALIVGALVVGIFLLSRR